jgi:Ca2+-binding EF-hand superfamily protein
MNSHYRTALGMVAALMLMAGCSDDGSYSAGEPLPAPMPISEAESLDAQEESADSAFAAFDTDANGVIDESEWENREARSMVDLKNRTFAQIDRDSNGGIDPQEFANARADGGGSADTGRSVRDSAADTTGDSPEPAQ